MGEYRTLYPFRQGDKITPPKEKVELDDDIAAPLLAYGLIEKAKSQASEDGVRLTSIAIVAVNTGDDKLAALAEEVSKAQQAVDAAREALAAAPASAKGVRTGILNKAEATLAKAAAAHDVEKAKTEAE
ncbi:MAG: hypothetical protein LBI35_01255 [Burkholderiales bacterium]|jgi:hypothetical protein|nr:hypothetical protein [Burkholderiales bacterium]